MMVYSPEYSRFVAPPHGERGLEFSIRPSPLCLAALRCGDIFPYGFGRVPTIILEYYWPWLYLIACAKIGLPCPALGCVASHSNIVEEQKNNTSCHRRSCVKTVGLQHEQLRQYAKQQSEPRGRNYSRIKAGGRFHAHLQLTPPRNAGRGLSVGGRFWSVVAVAGGQNQTNQRKNRTVDGFCGWL